MKTDILAFGAHPDDVELGAGGTVCKHVRAGRKVVVVDLTEGELGTRGNAALRRKEAAVASQILGIAHRENLGMKDGFFENDEAHLLKVITIIRKYRPEIVICNAIRDRHPDHGRAAKLVSRACFLSGLRKIETEFDGKSQEAFRPDAVYHYVQDHFINPDIVVDITDFMEDKMNAIKAFSSQFFNPSSDEPETPISGKEFLDFQYGRCIQMGRLTGVKYGEGFTVERAAGVNLLNDLK